MIAIDGTQKFRRDYAWATVYLTDKVKEMGKRGLIKFIEETIGGNWLNYDRIRLVVNSKLQLRLI